MAILPRDAVAAGDHGARLTGDMVRGQSALNAGGAMTIAEAIDQVENLPGIRAGH
jgi:hypothetical protein